MNITLAYCIDNKDIADEIDFKLRTAGMEFQHISGDHIQNNQGLANQISDPEQKVLLLISDNFLKSTECMYQALFMLQANVKTQHIQPIIIDGRYPQEDGSQHLVPTTFDRVSDVIQYMNYWQEHYLSMRKQKRAFDDENQAQFDQRLKVIRSISSEVGEFLRLLRGSDYWTYDQFIHDEFELFFKTAGQINLHEKYKTQIANAQYSPVEATSELTLSSAAFDDVPVVFEPEENLIEEILEEAPVKEEVHEEEEVMVELSKPNNSHLVTDEQNTESENNPLLEKLIEYQQDRLAGKDMGDLSDEHYNPKLDEVVEEVEEEEKDLIDQAPDASEDQLPYHLIDSIFDDEDDDDEIEEEEEDTTVANIPPSSSETPEQQFEDLSVEESIQHARQMIQSGEVTSGLAILQSALDKDPENIRLRFLYANCLIETTHEYEHAIIHLERIIQIDPLNIEAYRALAVLAEIRHDYLLAKSYYEKIISIEPHQPDVYFKLGKIVSNYYEDQKPQAAKYFKKAIKQAPENPTAHYQYALLLSDHLGKTEKAIEHLDQTLALDKNHPFANYDLALIYHRLNRMKKASKHYRKAYKINPELRTKENDIAFKFKSKKEAKKEAAPPSMSSNFSIPTENYLGFTGDEVVEEVLPADFLKATGIDVEEIEVSLEETSPPKNKAIHTKTILITGATSGIGRATAELFASKGYRLILTGRRTARLEELKDHFHQEHDCDVKILSFDVRDAETVNAAIEHLPEDWRAVDVLINNAGLAKGYAPIYEGNLSDWETMIDTNIKGLLYLTRAISPYMVKRRSGHIINLSSSAGKEVYPNGNVYCATKHAVEALTKAMRIELHQHNIRVSQVSPGHVEETEFAFVRFEDAEKAKIYEDFQPLKAIDVAETIHFIVSRPAYVNIQDIVLFGTQQASNLFIDRSGRKDED